MFDWDRIIFWLVVLTPVLTVVGAAFWGRWKGVHPQQRSREMLWTGLIGGLALGGFVLWELFFRERNNLNHVHFQNPLILLGLLPIYGILLLLQWKTLSGLSAGRLWFSFLTRSAVMILLGMALAGLQMVLQKDDLTVIFALDRSKSVSITEAKRAMRFIEQALPSKQANDQAGLLFFGGKTATEVWPKKTFQVPKNMILKTEIQPDATNIAAALRAAKNTFTEGTGKRLVLFTDGRQTYGDAMEELQSLKAAGIDIFIVPLHRNKTAEILIEKIKIPPNLRWEQEFSPTVFVFSNRDTTAEVTLYTGGKKGQGSFAQIVKLKAHQSTPVHFRGLTFKTPGYKQIEAHVRPLIEENDTLLENNHAYSFTEVDSDSRVLILTSDTAEVTSLVKALETEKVAIDVRSGATLPENPEAYRRYDCIVLANLARGFLGEQQMAVIESCVRDQGAGLIMIGGDQSFGAGGYMNTPIERALPVSMDLRNQRIMPSGALGIVLHTCEFPNGDGWGKKITKAAINVLSDQDYAGVVYYSYSGNNKWLFRPTLVSRKKWMFSLVDGVSPGDMPDLDGVISMAVTGIARLPNVSLKHCIVITDGDPNPPSPKTIAAAKNAKLSISIITIFPHGGAGTITNMKNICAQTGGRFYNPSDPRKLPLIFIKEAAIVRKNLVYQNKKGIPVSLGAQAEILKEFGSEFPNLRALVVTNPKKRAEMHLYTVVEGDKVPVMARWQYGLGKAIAFTGDATNRWAKDWVEWHSYDKFWTNLFHWVSRQRMPSNHTISTSIKDGKGTVIIDALDKNGEHINTAKLIGVASEPGKGSNLDATSFNLKFTMDQPGRYIATFPIKKQGAYTVTITDVSTPSKPTSIVTGLSNSYSSEFRHLEPDLALLNKLGKLASPNSESRLMNLATWKKNPQQSGLFLHNLPPVNQPTDLFWALLLAALCLFPLDVAIRRLQIDPLVGILWLVDKVRPAFGFLKTKKSQVVEATQAPVIESAPLPLIPTGSSGHGARSQYEAAGESADAQGLDLSPQADPRSAKPTMVGGKKISPVDTAATDYTRALLKAKRRARKKD